jgi:hypothetical protein
MTERRYPLRIAACWLLSLSMLYSGVAWAYMNASAGSGMLAAAAAVGGAGSDLNGIYRQIESIRSNLDRSQFDLEELLFSLEFDVDSVIEFVSQEIRFQQYQGLLRSAHGTLISRAGNSLDQGVLLARLLNDAGYEARIVEGSLAREDALRLLSTMSGDTGWPDYFAEGRQGFFESLVTSRLTVGDTPQAGLKLLGDRAGASLDSSRKQLEHVSASVAPAVDLIMDKGKSVSIDAASVLVDELKQYFWVEYRTGVANDWTAAHPAFGSLEPPTVDAKSYLADSVPDDLQHRVRIQVFIESRLGSAVSTQPLMSAWERPAANAAYQPQEIAFLPYSGSEAEDADFLEHAASSAELFVPTFNTGLAPGAKVFTLDGNVVPLDALSPAGEFVKQVSDKGAQAISALEGLGSDDSEAAASKPPRAMNRLWIEYTLIAPGGNEESIVRSIVDTDDDGRRFVTGRQVEPDEFESEARPALLQGRSLAVATGPVNPAWLMDRMLAAAEDGQATLSELEQRAGRAGPDDNAAIMKGLDPLPDMRWMKYFMATRTGTGFSDNGATYAGRPAITSFNHGVYANGDGLRGYDQIDILFNSTRAVSVTDDGPSFAQAGALASGLFETFQEHRLMESRSADGSSSAFDALADKSESLVAVTPGDPSKLASIGLSPAAMLHARQELASGYALLIPQSSETAHWWRVDPATGTTTGMGIGPGGYGGVSASEYIVIGGIIIGTLLMYYGFYNCFTNESGLALFCCLVDSWLTGLFVAALAFVIAQLIGLGVGAVGASMGASTAEAQLVSAISTAAMIDVPATVISFTDFRIRACGSATGT